MVNEKVLYDDGKHKCIAFSFDDEEVEDKFLALNQYLIIQNNSAILLDPGSRVLFDEVYAAVQRYIPIDNLKYIFFSHQDPDVADSISEWAVATDAKFIISNIWTRFVSHYGLMDMNRLHGIADKGGRISFGDDFLHLIPAHFLHSPGNFSLYDSKSKILFSGDIGANISEEYGANKEFTDFEVAKQALEGFHKRYMAGNKFCKAWVKRVRAHEVEMIASQHGVIFKGEQCGEFLEWFDELQCGGDLIDTLY